MGGSFLTLMELQEVTLEWLGMEECIIRDWAGQLKKEFAIRMGIPYAPRAELLALKQGLCMVTEIGLRKVIVQLDSNIVL